MSAGGLQTNTEGGKRWQREMEFFCLFFFFLYKVLPTLEEFWDLKMYEYAFLDSYHNVDLYTPKKEKDFSGRCIIYSCPSCKHCFCLLLSPLFAPCAQITSHNRWGKGVATHKIYYQSAFVCVCVCVRMSRGVSNTIRSSLSDLPHLL